MITPKSSQAIHTPRRILSEISNGVPASRGSSRVNGDNTPGRNSDLNTNTRNGKRGTFGIDGFISSRQLSKAHGDLSNIRPKSPTLYDISVAMSGPLIGDRSTELINSSCDNILEDSYDLFPERYNRTLPGKSDIKDSQVFGSLRAAQPDKPLTSENGHAVSQRHPHQYARTPRYRLGSPLAPLRMRKRYPYHFEIPSDTPEIIVGGLNLGYSSALDLYQPIIRAYPAEEGRAATSVTALEYLRLRPPVEHIDICTTWKGLSFKEAEILFQLHQIFKESLQELIADHLHEQDQIFREQHSRSPINSLRSSDTATFCSRLIFSRTRLVESMVRLLQQSREHTGGFEKLLPFYLTSCDHLVDIERSGAQNTAIDLQFQYNRSFVPDNPCKLTVEAGWSPDFLTFEQLTILPREGEELKIIPRYNSNAVFRIDDHHTDLRYSLETPLPWLTWDDQIQGFRGVVPMYSEIRAVGSRFGRVYRPGRVGPHAIVNQLRIEIKALFTECCQHFLYLERTVRIRLTLRVIPWYANDNANAPDDESVRPISPGNAQGYVDNLFIRGISQEIDPQRNPAAPLQVRRVTGLSSLLGRDGFFSIGLSSQASSDQSVISGYENVENRTSSLQSCGEETVSIEAQSSKETSSNSTASTPGSQKDDARLDSVRGSTGYGIQRPTSAIRTGNSSTSGSDHEKEYIPASLAPVHLYNHYSPLRGLKEDIDILSDGNGDECSVVLDGFESSSTANTSSCVRHEKRMQGKKQRKKNATSRLGAWAEDILLASGGVAVPANEIGLL